ncbi:C45 family autoproteolytic acyltransferase/hydrolase [Streptomyces sp. NPDC127068]|uniref:C45 family autoproteolytic acyltransferase/hydolase n=1 Tax=Streptomyces sp. NPDC127068 TaxID=3347127 RepID=UPI0036461189
MTRAAVTPPGGPLPGPGRPATVATLPTFHSDDPDPARRGRTFGRTHGHRIRAAAVAYRELFTAVDVAPHDLRPHGEQASEEIARWAPELHAELVATAAGAGLPVWELAMLNARTEILATVGATAEGECSTAVHLGGPGAPHTIQTWDWHDEMAFARTLTRHRTDAPGPTVRTFTEAGALAKIGVNDAGLGVHFNILSHRADGDGIGVPVHVVARRILERATTVAEAVDIARSARVTASTVLTVVTHDGRHADAASIEVCPAGVAVVRPDTDGYLLHTNHFLDPALALGENTPPGASTHPRYAHLHAHRTLLADPDPQRWVDLLRAHDSDGAPVCCHPQDGLPFQLQWRTLLTVSIDVASARLRLHPGGPCTATPDTWIHL